MKKLGAVLCILILFSGVSFGQGVSIMGGLTFPTGDFGDLYDTGFGLKGTFEYPISPGLGITGTTGYLHWSTSETFFGESLDITTTSIPLLGGVRYYFGAGDLLPYVNAELGLHILSVKAELFGESESESETEFGFGVGGGLLFAIGPNLFLDANAKYNSISTEGTSLDFISLFVGVRIPL